MPGDGWHFHVYQTRRRAHSRGSASGAGANGFTSGAEGSSPSTSTEKNLATVYDHVKLLDVLARACNRI